MSNSSKEQWIRFADRTPPEDTEILIWYATSRRRPRGYVSTLDYDSVSYDLTWLAGQGITHWMPLPEGPTP